MKKLLSKITCTLLFFSLTTLVFADEGMWLLPLVKQQNADKMSKLGMKISYEKIDGMPNGDLSESVVAFGSGCTGSVISDEGLVLTNYHCSYSAISQYNEKLDVFNRGFWAINRKNELKVDGLSVKINRSILDVSGKVLNQVIKRNDNDLVRKAISKVTDDYQKQFPGKKISVKSYKNNTIFILYVQDVYEDVRLVGVPPRDVAKFGGETDNWMWPRHNADFAYFRIYADKNGNPAPYSLNNIPLATPSYLKITEEGYNKGDFAMSLGYPAMNNRTASSSQIWEVRNVTNPPLIAVSSVFQTLLEKEMSENSALKNQYYEKYLTSANNYKNAVGINQWIDITGLIAKKAEEEKCFFKTISTEQKPEYSGVSEKLMKEMDSLIHVNSEYKKALFYLSHSMRNTCEAIRFVSSFGQWMKSYQKKEVTNGATLKDFKSNVRRYYQSVNISFDKKITFKMIRLLKDSVSQKLLPQVFASLCNSDSEIERFVNSTFEHSMFADSSSINSWLKNPTIQYEEDPMVKISYSVAEKERELTDIIRNNQKMIDNMSYKYHKAYLEYLDGNYYPDADRTIRLSYGTITDLNIKDSHFPFQTFAKGIIEKSKMDNPDYKLNPRYRQALEINSDNKSIYENMPVCFITNGDVTGGNSGTPMLNAKGEIIGLVFDCNWESMTRDFKYLKENNRAVCLDVRYMLFITNKFSGSNLITDEIRGKK